MVRLWAWLGVGAVLTACAVDAELVATGRCQTDGDCRSGRRCFESSLCVAAEVAPMPVLVHLKPPKQSGLVDEHFEVVVDSHSSLQPTDLVLAEPAVVRGKILRGGDLMSLSLPGTLMASAAGKVAGHGLSYSAVAGNVQSAANGETFGYELRLPIGHTYDLAFWPESDLIPPFYATLVANASMLDWNLELPAANQLLRLHGELRWAGAPATGLQVVLEDAAGRVRSRHVACSGGGSDAPEVCKAAHATGKDGSFLLLIDPAALAGDQGAPNKLSLRVRPTSPESPLPRGRLPLSGKIRQQLQQAAMMAKPEVVVELGQVSLGSPGVALDVDVLVRTAEGKPVAGAWVSLEQHLAPIGDGGGPLRIEVNGSADAKGVFHARLPPGQVQVSVSPLATSSAGAVATTAEVNGSAILVACPRRGVIAGRLTDELGVALAGAQISLHRLGPPVGAEGDAEETSKPLLTDAHGVFSGHLDAGSYDLWVEPLDGAGLPRALLQQVSVAAAGEVKLELVVPAPAVLTGRVRTANGAAVAGVQVEVLTEALPTPLLGKPSEAQPSAVTAQHDSHVLATAMTGAGGVFTALVAAHKP
jgi:hypothetical protein